MSPGNVGDLRPGFWRGKTLAQLSPTEWEALCDGCGRCCLLTLVDGDSGAHLPTRLACPLLRLSDCRCVAYTERATRVPGCVVLSPTAPELDWMPDTCAYRRVAEGRPLAPWHPLLARDPQDAPPSTGHPAAAGTVSLLTAAAAASASGETLTAEPWRRPPDGPAATPSPDPHDGLGADDRLRLLSELWAKVRPDGSSRGYTYTLRTVIDEIVNRNPTR